MHKSFIMDRTKDSLFEGLGLAPGEATQCYKTLATAIEKEMLEFGEISEEGNITLSDSLPEYMLAVTEFLDRELTPELGFALGLIMSDIGEITQKVAQLLRVQGRM